MVKDVAELEGTDKHNVKLKDEDGFNADSLVPLAHLPRVRRTVHTANT